MERRTARIASLAIVFALYGCGSSNKTIDAATDRPVTNDAPLSEGGPRVEAGVDVPMATDGNLVDGPRDAPRPVDVPPGVEAGLQGTGSKAIGPGGSVTSVDNRATLEIPPGALASLITFTIQPMATPATGAIGTTYNIGPFGTTFLIPAHVVFKPTAADITAGGGLASLRPATHDSAWTELANQIANTDSGTVRGDTPHLSTFGLVGGLCSTCALDCVVNMPCAYQGPDDQTPMAVGTGRCIAFGQGCSKCVPTCDLDGDGFCGLGSPSEFPGNDCNDNNASISPSAAEICGNVVDENCNGHQDEGCHPCTTDGDCLGLEVCTAGVCQLCAPNCDMANCRIGAIEGVPGSGVASHCVPYGRNMTCTVCVPMCDNDGDGYCTGAQTDPILGGDCNDNNMGVSPGSAEICGNGVDDNCDGVIDEGCAMCTVNTDCPAMQTCLGGLCQTCDTTCSAGTCPAATPNCVDRGNGCGACVALCDNDGDGFCPGAGEGGGDCDDMNAAVNPDPSTREVCGNSKDDNCDGHVDEGCRTCTMAADCAGFEDCINGKCEVCGACTLAECMVGNQVQGVCHPHGRGCSTCVPACDMDGDGYCPGNPGMDLQGGDCNDDVATGAAINPGAREICGNGIDDDCNGAIDDGCMTCQMAAMCGATQSCSSGK